MINADGKIVHSNDFSVNEASLTGESFSVLKILKQTTIRFTAALWWCPDWQCLKWKISEQN
jgi:magnesium-transporting ATPase (P-type)